jgi:hypothetical protein
VATTDIANAVKAPSEEGKDHLADFRLVEYKALRDEIVRRLGVRIEILGAALVATGAFLQFAASQTTILYYPIFALFLAASWVHNEIGIRRLGRYICRVIEPGAVGDTDAWENWRLELPRPRIVKSLSLLSGRGVFVGTQIGTLLVGALRPNLTTEDWILILVDLIAMGITILLLVNRELNDA